MAVEWADTGSATISLASEEAALLLAGYMIRHGMEFAYLTDPKRLIVSPFVLTSLRAVWEELPGARA